MGPPPTLATHRRSSAAAAPAGKTDSIADGPAAVKLPESSPSLAGPIEDITARRLEHKGATKDGQQPVAKSVKNCPAEKPSNNRKPSLGVATTGLNSGQNMAGKIFDLSTKNAQLQRGKELAHDGSNFGGNPAKNLVTTPPLVAAGRVFAENSGADATAQGLIGNVLGPKLAASPSWSSLFKEHQKLNTSFKLKKWAVEDKVVLNDDDLCDFGHCLVGYMLGKFLGMKSIHEVRMSGKRNHIFSIHESGWMIFMLEEETDRDMDLHPELPLNAHPKLLDMMQRCWEATPGNRHSFSQIRVELEGLLLEVQKLPMKQMTAEHMHSIS